jgi:hypothetical protein
MQWAQPTPNLPASRVEVCRLNVTSSAKTFAPPEALIVAKSPRARTCRAPQSVPFLSMHRRATWIVVALSPLTIVASSFFVSWRPSHSGVALLGYLLFGLGGFIALLNLYLSILRVPLLRRLRPGAAVRHLSGVPLCGVLNVSGLMLCPRSVTLSVVALVLLPLDTGSISWFVAAVWRDSGFWQR